MRHVEFRPSNMVCTRLIEFDLDENNLIHNAKFTGGCNGNLKAISKLIEGKKAEDVAEILKGNLCGQRSTSCADQLSIALLKAINS